MLAAILEAVAGIAFEFLLTVLFWVLLLPIGMIVATPFLLIAALYGEGRYREKLRCRYRDCWRFWFGVIS